MAQMPQTNAQMQGTEHRLLLALELAKLSELIVWRGAMGRLLHVLQQAGFVVFISGSLLSIPLAPLI